MQTRRVAVIGAGIAGLTAAHTLKKGGLDVILFEKEADVGGRMATRIKDGLPFDIGAQFLTTRNYYPETYRYCEELGLAHLWEPQSPHCHHLFRAGRLYDTSYTSFLEFIRFSHLSPLTRLRMLLMTLYLQFKVKQWDLFAFGEIGKKWNLKNSHEFILRAGGEEMVNYVIDPLVAAYQFHSTKELSLSAFFGLAHFVLRSTPSPTIHHLIGEMSTLPRAISKELTVHTSTAIQEVKSSGKAVAVSTDRGSDSFDAVIIATPAPAALKFFKTASKRQKELLELVQYAACINVAFRVPTAPIQHLAVVMVPFLESQAIASYVHQAPKGRDSIKNGKSLVNVLLHDTYALEIMQKPDNEVFDLVKRAFLRSCPPLAPCSSAIENYDLQKWPQAMPKFSQETVSQVERFWTEGQGDNQVFLCGDYLNSPWIEGGIRCGKRVALMVQKTLQRCDLQ